MDDSLTRSRPKSPSDILRGLRENPTGLPKTAAETTEPSAMVAEMPVPEAFGPEFFDASSKDYKAFGWAFNKTVPSLRFILKDGSQQACSFHHLDSRYPGGCEFIPSAPGKPNLIKLRFAGAASGFSVILEGRNLGRGFELIMGHQTPWVREYPADIDTLDPDAIVVRSITFPPEK